ncbi:MAG TPA: hypothetical protein VLJ39_17305 [Tepidisphaeraceae bacterium]|nr:hypothetical protein [Tepidisphaeraceae bacterium]
MRGAALLIGAALCGCASTYAVPGRGAEMRMFGAERDQLSDGSVVKTLSKRPLAELPTTIAVVRVQSSGYSSATAQGWGSGAYSVVTQRDIENQEDKLKEIRKLPMVSDVAPLNRLLLPTEFHSDLELRQAAASLHADMLLVYTLDTTFNVEDVAAPLTVVSLGLSPNQVAHVGCTASAVLLDTRNGYVYGLAEATERQSQLASGWTNEAAVDQTRRRVEAKAFEKLVTGFETSWPSIVQNLTPTRRAAMLDPR